MPIYLDYHSHAPVHPQALEAMIQAYAELDANPHSTHLHGAKAHEAVELARSQVAQLLSARPSEVVFTSGATESNNLAFAGLVEHLKERARTRIVVGALEHPSVLKAAGQLAHEGFDIVTLPVSGDGIVDLGTAEELITPETGLVSVAAANHEIGVLQPIDRLSEIARVRGAYLHSDLAQAAGKTDVDVRLLDLASISAHKLGGPGGIGALFVRRLLKPKMTAHMAGGGQEAGLRSGTLAAPLCVGFGTACHLSAENADENRSRIRGHRDALLRALLGIPGARLNGSAEARLPGNINISFDDVDGEALSYHLQRDISISTGSTCSAKSLEPSPVLLALGLGRTRAECAVRIGIGEFTTAGEIDFAARSIAAAVAELRSTRRRA